MKDRGATRASIDGRVAICQEASAKTSPRLAVDEAAKWRAGRVQSLGLRATSLDERACAVGFGSYV
eukprot:10421030-Alexandrium_andersonii.AAC.1